MTVDSFLPQAPMLQILISSTSSLSRTQRSGLKTRSAVSTIEVLLSTLLLTVVMSTATSLCFRIHQVWKGIVHQRVATHELANQLERLTRMDAKEVTEALKGLQASDLCCRTLLNPQLQGQLSEDELGRRISLELRWETVASPMLARLDGWLIQPEPASQISRGKQELP